MIQRQKVGRQEFRYQAKLTHGAAIVINEMIYLIGGGNASEPILICPHALIHPQINGLRKRICQRLGHGLKLVWFE